jgi:8-oxo-dGTP pyrophosphatase MutT (NUDIX family)
MAKKIIYRAGVIPYIVEDGEVKMLFMRPSDGKYGGDVFQLAKGKFEEGETAEEAGLREASEELGLFSGNVEQLTELGVFMVRTTVFIAKIKDKDHFGEPHFETKEVKWMTAKEFQATGRDLHKPVIKAAVRKIEKLEKQ